MQQQIPKHVKPVSKKQVKRRLRRFEQLMKLDNMGYSIKGK